MTTHSSILAWEISWTEELSWLQSMGLKESDKTDLKILIVGVPRSSVGKESACNAGDLGSISGLGRYYPF